MTPCPGSKSSRSDALRAGEPGRQAVLSTAAPRRAVTLDEVRAHRDVILRLGQRLGVRNIRVFGSVARGDAIPGSNPDLLVDVDRGHGRFDMAGFALEVEDDLGVMTQVATLAGVRFQIRDRVLWDAVALRA